MQATLKEKKDWVERLAGLIAQCAKDTLDGWSRFYSYNMDTQEIEAESVTPLTLVLLCEEGSGKVVSQRIIEDLEPDLLTSWAEREDLLYTAMEGQDGEGTSVAYVDLATSTRRFADQHLGLRGVGGDVRDREQMRMGGPDLADALDRWEAFEDPPLVVRRQRVWASKFAMATSRDDPESRQYENARAAQRGKPRPNLRLV